MKACQYPNSSSVQGNILITEEGNACLGDFGITAIITDRTVMELQSMTTSKPGVARYMAPELLNPPQFGSAHGSYSKESDVYSFAMASYEVFFAYVVTRIVNRHFPMTRSSRGCCRTV